MGRKAFSVIIIAVALIAIASFPSITYAESPQLKRIVITSGPMGGTWYPGMAVMAEIIMKAIPGLEVTNIEGTAIGNLRVVGLTKDANIGGSSLPYFYNALEGKGVFKKKIPDLCALMAFEKVVSQWIVLADSPIRKIEDLIGKRLGLVRMGSAGEMTARYVLEASGVTYDKIKKAGGKTSFTSHSEFPTLMRDGHIDVFSLQGPYPHPRVIEMQAFKKIRALPVPEEIIRKVCEKYPGFFKAEIPPGVYDNKNPIPLVGTTNLLFTRKDLPKDLGYKIVKAIIENKQRVVEVNKNYDFISRENAMKGLKESMMHPGALKYIKSQ